MDFEKLLEIVSRREPGIGTGQILPASCYVASILPSLADGQCSTKWAGYSPAQWGQAIKESR